MKIFALGTEEIAVGFGLDGVKELYSIEPQPEFEGKLSELIKRSDIGLIIVNSEFIDNLSPKLKKTIRQLEKPIIIDVVGSGQTVRKSDIREQIKRAIGVDIMAQQS